MENPPANAGVTGDTGVIPGSGRSPGGGNGNPLQYSCLGNTMDQEASWATVHEETDFLRGQFLPQLFLFNNSQHIHRLMPLSAEKQADTRQSGIGS